MILLLIWLVRTNYALIDSAYHSWYRSLQTIDMKGWTNRGLHMKGSATTHMTGLSYYDMNSMRLLAMVYIIENDINYYINSLWNHSAAMDLPIYLLKIYNHIYFILNSIENEVVRDIILWYYKCIIHMKYWICEFANELVLIGKLI